MWVGTGSVWGPKLGVQTQNTPGAAQGAGLGHGQQDGGKVDPLQPRARGRSSPAVMDFKKSSGKAPESPQGGCRGHNKDSRLGRQLTLSWGTTSSWSKVLSASESPWHLWRVRILAHTGLSHSGVTDLIFFSIFFSPEWL